MKIFYKVFYLLIVLILIIVTIYFFANCYVKIPDGTFSVLRNTNSGEIKVLSPGRHILIEGLFPGRIIFRSFSNSNNLIFYPKVKIPQIDTIDDETLAVRMALNVSYLIDSNKIQISKIFFNNSNDIFNDIILSYIRYVIKSELLAYFSPNYTPELIINESKKIIEKAFNKLKQQVTDTGFVIQKFELIGSIELPSKELFYNELKYLNELKGIEKNNKKELLILQNKLLNEQKLENNYYNKLKEISKLIKDNPDLLKYIYIDKMTDKVKVIITSDRLGFPPGLINDDELEKLKAKGELDRFR